MEPPQPETPESPARQPPQWMLRRKARLEKNLQPAKDLVARAVEHRESLIDRREQMDDETRLALRVGLRTLRQLTLEVLQNLPSP